jgi:hypothetical protein
VIETPNEPTAHPRLSGVGRSRSALRPATGAPFFSRAALLTASLAALCALVLPTASASAATTIAGPGTGAEQVDDPASTAVDQSTGTLYVGEDNNFRVDEFDPSKPAGERFIRAFGWGVRNGASELQACTAATGCQRGVFDSETGRQVNPGGMAVDPTTHNLYVSDKGAYRVQEFNPAGEFVLMLGQEVNKTTLGNVCTAASHNTCGAGITGTGPGAFGHTANLPYMPLAFDQAGHLWVGDVDRLEEFSAAGAFLSEVAVPGEGSLSGLAIDATGNFYTLSEPTLFPFEGHLQHVGPPELHKYDSTGSPLDFTSLGTNALDEGGFPLSLASDGAGHLYVGDQPSFADPYRFLEFDAVTGAQIEAFGAGEVIGRPGQNNSGQAIAVGAASQLYAASSQAEPSAVQTFTQPPTGPVVRNLSASPIHGTFATLTAILNSEGAEAHYRFQYLTQTQFEADGNQFGAGTHETSEATLAAGFSEPVVSAPISGLTGETPYRFRILASNVNGTGNTEEEIASFTTTPPVRIDSTYTTEVAATSATLNAQLNPLGTASEYRFEYLTEAKYQQNITEGADPFATALTVPSPDGALAGIEEDILVSEHIQGLVPGTIYRYRVTAHNGGGSKSSAPLSFTTQAPAPFALPDSRAWELVSPAEKHGALLRPLITGGDVLQAAAGGDAVTYVASSPTETDAAGFTNLAQILSGRAAGGWQSREISLPNLFPTGVTIGGGQQYRFFSTDLSHSIAESIGNFDPQISPLATEATPYLRTDFPAGEPAAICSTSCYRPLVTGAEGVADVPAGLQFSVDANGVHCVARYKFFCGPQFVGASPDLAHVVLRSTGVGLTSVPGDHGGLYEYSAAAPPGEALQIVSLLPSGEPAPAATAPILGTSNGNPTARNAVSADGSRVIWSEQEGAAHHLYLRDTTLGQTVQLDAKQGGNGKGAAHPVFQDASADGSHVFFTDTQALTAGSGAEEHNPDLYECRVEEVEGGLKCALTDLTPKVGLESAGVRGTIVGSSTDGSTVYFVANGILTNQPNGSGERATPGTCGEGNSNPPTSTCNLYRRHDGSTTFIAVLSGADAPDWGDGPVGGLATLTARTSPDGHWLAFMSQRPLTGFDSHDAVSGEPDEEVFLYHAGGEGETGRLVCASCNPTGARPHGVEYEQINASISGLAGGDRVWPDSTWIAASVPGWTPFGNAGTLYQSRYLSNSGRLFFNSSDALAPGDTNATEDVYQYEPPQGEGAAPADTCTPQEATYDPASAGCLALISSGTSAQESAFVDASETGSDVFFLTHARLTNADLDTALDLYDARAPHAPGEQVGFPEPIPPTECAGDACQLPATPPDDATPGSLTFQGAGNVLECPKGKQLKAGKCVARKQKAKKQTKHHKKNKHKKNSKKQPRADSKGGGHK